MDGVGINYVSRRLIHASIKPTLVYLEPVPDPAGSLANAPYAMANYGPIDASIIAGKAGPTSNHRTAFAIFQSLAPRLKRIYVDDDV